MRTFDDAIRNRFEPSESYRFIFDSEEEQRCHTVRPTSCVDVVNSFYYFLLGSGFHRDSIVSAFEQTLEEVCTMDKIGSPTKELDG